MSSVNEDVQAVIDAFPPFYLQADEVTRQTNDPLDVLQINIGSRCNLSCRHCHVEAGPQRSEAMSRETLLQCLEVGSARGFSTLDVTGGAPEMNPHFTWLIREAAKRRLKTIVRSNLVIMNEPPYAHLPELFADLRVSVVASLPHYAAKPVEEQRGDEVFSNTIALLQKLNALGYGAGQGLILNLMFNPGGADLPPDQETLEKEYRQKLAEDHHIVFDHLFALANIPLGRFGNMLYRTGALKRYMGKLVDAFNPQTLSAMMCRSQLSVGWDGVLYDCDFNQAAGLPCKSGLTIADLAADPAVPLRRTIAFRNHCYACCAGAGSS